VPLWALVYTLSGVCYLVLLSITVYVPFTTLSSTSHFLYTSLDTL